MASENNKIDVLSEDFANKILVNARAAAISPEERIQSKIADWYYLADARGVSYFHVSDAACAVNAKVMNARIPKMYWEEERTEDGSLLRRNNRIVRVPPSDSILNVESQEIKGTVIDPRQPLIFENFRGERFLNQYRPFVFPPKPEQKYFKVKELVEKWLELIYPGRGDFILDTWAHMVQRPAQKLQFSLIFGGSQGIGKDNLLHIATRALRLQNFVSDIRMKHIVGNSFEEYLLRPILILNEFFEPHAVYGSDFINTLKSYTTTPPDNFTVNIKNQRLTTVANTHRLFITTNHEDRFPREQSDRRFLILSSGATKEQVFKFIEDFLNGGNLNEFIENGGADAFVHILNERDISGFDHRKLPQALLDDYDQVPVGFQSNDMILDAMIEITRKWRAEEGFKDDTEGSEDPSLSQENWPEIVCKEEIKETLACSNPENHLQFTDIIMGRKKNALDQAMSDIGYQRVKFPKDILKIQSRRGDSVSHVISSYFYIKRSYAKTLTNAFIINRCKCYARKLNEYWRTPKGLQHKHFRAKDF